MLSQPAPEPPNGDAPGRAATLVSSFRYAFAGIGYCMRSQRNFRIHCVSGAAAAVLAVILGISPTEWAVLALIITMVLAAEMINTVVEAVVDLASPGFHPLAKIAKDAAAGAVLINAIGAVVVGIWLFLPHLLALI